jgi:hypothetical protein
MWRSDGLEQIVDHMFHKMRRYVIATPEMTGWLAPVDKRFFDAGMYGANPDGLYHPQKTGSASDAQD